MENMRLLNKDETAKYLAGYVDYPGAVEDENGVWVLDYLWDRMADIAFQNHCDISMHPSGTVILTARHAETDVDALADALSVNHRVRVQNRSILVFD